MKRVALMFAGQGAQYVGMGQSLYENCPAARALYETADRVLGKPLTRICFEGPAETLTESRWCQPAIYVTSLACRAALQDALPLEPVAVSGLSLGEFAALQTSGVISFEDGVRLVAKRGELMQAACEAHGGAMLAVLNAEPPLVREICEETAVDIANLNCPGQIVISGSEAGVAAARQALADRGVSRMVPLPVAGAYHSRLMTAAADAFADLLPDVPMSPPGCALLQNVAGKAVRDVPEIRANLARQVSGSVHWEDCVRGMLALGLDAIVELGPGKVLSGFMRRIDRSVPTVNLAEWNDRDRVVEALTT